MQKVRRGHQKAETEAQQISGVIMEWREKAMQAASRIDPAHTSPWKLASTYALLSIAESLASGRPNRMAPKASGELRCANEQCAMYREPGTPVTHGDQDILTLAEVAEMTRTNPATLRYWRSVGVGGPESFKLGRRVMYRRADVEKWLEEAQ
jgi:predicted DNA-binding transcriptional regulator AlpA